MNSKKPHKIQKNNDFFEIKNGIVLDLPSAQYLIKLPFHITQQKFMSRSFLLYPIEADCFIAYQANAQDQNVYLIKQSNGMTNVARIFKPEQLYVVIKVTVLNRNHVLITAAKIPNPNNARGFVLPGHQQNIIQRQSCEISFWDWNIEDGSFERIFDITSFDDPFVQRFFSKIEKKSFDKREILSDQYIIDEDSYLLLVYVFPESKTCSLIEVKSHTINFYISQFWTQDKLDFKWRILRHKRFGNTNIIKMNNHSQIAIESSFESGLLTVKYMRLKETRYKNFQPNFDIEIKLMKIDLRNQFINNQSFIITKIIQIKNNLYYFEFSKNFQKAYFQQIHSFVIEFQEKSDCLIQKHVTAVDLTDKTQSQIQFSTKSQILFSQCQSNSNLPIFYIDSQSYKLLYKQQRQENTYKYFPKNRIDLAFEYKFQKNEDNLTQVRVKKIKGGLYLPYIYFFLIESWIPDCDEDILYEAFKLYDTPMKHRIIF